MAKSRVRTGGIVGGGALLLVLIVAGVLGGMMWSQTRGTQRKLIAQYEEISEQSRTRRYSRAPDPPGWSLEQGSAAALYQEAWGACDMDGTPRDVKLSFSDALRAYTGDPTPGQGDSKSPLIETGSHPVWGQCRNAGIPDLEDDAVITQLTPEACDHYAACWPVLELVRRGSRRSDTTSPVHLWSSWSAVDGGPDYRSLVPFVELSKIELLAGYMAGLHGDPWAPAQSACTVLRCSMRWTSHGWCPTTPDSIPV